MAGSQNEGPISSHRKVLEGAFSENVVQAIEGRIGEVTKELLAELKAELTLLIEKHKNTIDEVRAMPPSPERDDVDAVTDQATEELKAAADAVNELSAQVEEGGSADDDGAKDAVAKAKKAVYEVSDELADKVAAHDRDIDELKRGLAAVNFELDQVGACANEAIVVSERAEATADSSVNAGNGRFEHASRIALVVFVAAAALYLLYLLFWGLTWLDWTLRDQFAWPFGFGAVAWWLAFLFYDEDDESTSSNAYAEADAQADYDHDHRGVTVVEHYPANPAPARAEAGV